MMGQAKKRGTFEQRKKAAIDRRAQDIAEQKERTRHFGPSRVGGTATLLASMLALTGGKARGRG